MPHTLASPDTTELTLGSLSHYAEPRYYDKCYGSRHHDIAFYRSLGSGSHTILEYGCGNGRITRPLARDGAQVVGVDLSRPMLDSFRDRLPLEPPEVRDRITLVQADMRERRFRTRFDLVVCTFNTFLHLYDRNDVERFLSRVRRHLTPNGRFAFDTSLPLPIELARDPNRPFRVPRLKHPEHGQVVRYAEYFDYDPMSQVLKVTMQFEPISDPDAAWSVLLTHRQFHPQEIEALLHYNGFELVSVHPNLDGPEETIDSIGWVARLAR